MRSFALVTFGCQMNQHDSERIEEALGRAGLSRVGEPALADLVLLNTCSVREKAEQKLRSEVGRLGLLKRQRPELLIGVAGCVAQQEGERLARSMPQIDLVIGPDNIGELPDLLRELDGGGPPRVRTEFDLDAPRFLEARPNDAPRSAFVTVMKGCNERCTFCIVPHTRGPERYRPAREVIDEIARLVAAGTREVTLLGQTVNSYTDPEAALGPAPGAGELPWTATHPTTARADESEFAALLRAISERVPDLLRLRYTSPHPRHLTMSLIRAHQELPVLCRHVHLPVQSGSDRVLRRMLRRYDVAEYTERVARLRASVPGITLSTDIIVGFPGESRADFEQTLTLVQRIGFTGTFGFKYSARPHTPAQKLADDVSEGDKSERLAELFALTDRLRRDHLTALVGSTQRVLVEGLSAQGGYTGRTEQNEIVHFGSRAQRVGQIVELTIARAFNNSLEGRESDATLFAPLPERRGAREPAPSARVRSLPVL